MDGRMDAWMDGCMDGQTDGQIGEYRKMVRHHPKSL